jgi:hypothetical protein
VFWKAVKLNVLITNPDFFLYFYLFGNAARFSGYVMSKGVEVLSRYIAYAAGWMNVRSGFDSHQV